jgi:DNA-binding response OmpR family regulator
VGYAFAQDIKHGGASEPRDGFGIMDWLRYIEGVDGTPVIFLTAADQVEHVERAKKAGAVELFQKTVETAELMGVIHQLLD